MAATKQDVRRALLSAHPYKIDTLDHAAEVAMAASEETLPKGDTKARKAKAAKLLEAATKGNGPSHFGLGDRAGRVIARLGGMTKWSHDPKPPESAAIPPTEREQDDDPGPQEDDAESVDPFGDPEELTDDERELFDKAMDKDGE